MRDIPILMDGESVRAVLAGRKGQTRRVVKPQAPSVRWSDKFGWIAEFGDGRKCIQCPYGSPGDRLWFRETVALEADGGRHHIAYRADMTRYSVECGAAWSEYKNLRPDLYYPRPIPEPFCGKWTPGIHMPKWASRLRPLVTAVRIECLHDLSEADARAEGVENVAAYTARWDGINGKGAWESNPWVWVVEFEKGTP